MAGMRPSKVLRDLFRKTLRLFDGLRPALYRHNGGLSKCIQGAREDRCVPRVSRRALIGKKRVARQCLSLSNKSHHERPMVNRDRSESNSPTVADCLTVFGDWRKPSG
jgi:hypothetical protein